MKKRDCKKCGCALAAEPLFFYMILIAPILLFVSTPNYEPTCYVIISLSFTAQEISRVLYLNSLSTGQWSNHQSCCLGQGVVIFQLTSIHQFHQMALSMLCDNQQIEIRPEQIIIDDVAVAVHCLHWWDQSDYVSHIHQPRPPSRQEPLFRPATEFGKIIFVACSQITLSPFPNSFLRNLTARLHWLLVQRIQDTSRLFLTSIINSSFSSCCQALAIVFFRFLSTIQFLFMLPNISNCFFQIPCGQNMFSLLLLPEPVPVCLQIFLP